MTETIDKRTNEFVSLIYEFMIDDDKSKGSIATFLLTLDKKDPLFLSECCDLHKITNLNNIFLIVDNYSKYYQNKKNEGASKESSIKNLFRGLEIIHFVRILTQHLHVDIEAGNNEQYFDYLFNESSSNLDIYLQKFIKSHSLTDIASLRAYFITRDLKSFTGMFRTYYDAHYEKCAQSIVGDVLPVLNYQESILNLKNKKIDLDLKNTKKEINNINFSFDEINDSYYLLKRIISANLSPTSTYDCPVVSSKIKRSDVFIKEEQFYNGIQKIDPTIILNKEYKKLLLMALSFPDNRSLTYLLTLNKDRFIIVNIIEFILQKKTGIIDVSAKFEIVIDYLGIDVCYETISLSNVATSSIVEDIFEQKKLYLLELLLQKGLDISKLPNLYNFLEFKFWHTPVESLPLFTFFKDYVTKNQQLLYLLCYSALCETNDSITVVANFMKNYDIDLFSVKDLEGRMLVHSMIQHMTYDKLNVALDYLFEHNHDSLEWKLTHDNLGNNFAHLFIYGLGFHAFSPYLVKNKELLTLFFTPDLEGRKPIDYVLSCEKESLPILINLIKIVVDEKYSFSNEVNELLEKHNSVVITHEKFRALLNNYNDKDTKQLLIELDKHYPVIPDYIMYDVYSKSDVDEFEVYVNEMLDEDNKVVPWVNKLRSASGSKKLMFSVQIKQNLNELRKTFPNFKEFIDHVENYIYLNDMGAGFFWIPASLLVSAPGIGKTFFLHCLSKAVGVSYDMISMESVTAGFVLVGSSQQWSGGQPGEVFQKVFKSEYANNILILDEVDKTPNSNYPVDTVLLPLLETHTAKKFKDEFVNMRMDISKLVWVATANNLDQISDPIKSRFQIFNIPSPNFEERMILTQAIYKTLLQDNEWGQKFEKVINHDVLVELSTDRNSSRDLRKTILDACGRAAKRKDNKLIIEDLNIIKTSKEILPWDKKHD